MTDNKIIKALRCCHGQRIPDCDNCPNDKTCEEIDVLDSVIDLINRQKAEIERLEKELQQSEQEADITGTILEERNKDIYDLIFKERSNAILEFVEALKQETDDDFVFMDIIDSLVKEMTEAEE